MRIIVHRGSHQIGGSCIELAAGSSRIILDAGLPLEADELSGPLVPPVAGLFDDGGPAVDGLFLSHAHIDHAGLIEASRADVPVWLTEGTSKMLLAGGLFARQSGVPRLRQRRLVPSQPVKVGAFQITALSVDHSIFDSVAILVEAEGRRLLYTGDLRFHGRKPGMMRQLVSVARAKPLDVLVIEGTRLGSRANEANMSEADLESQLVSDLAAASGTALAMYSPLNVDRFVTFFRAARKTKRTLVIDPYQAFVLHLVHNHVRVPRVVDSQAMRVLMPPNFASSRAGRRLATKRWAASLAHATISSEEIRTTPEKFLVLFRQSMQPWLYPYGLPRNVACIFSYWPGYLRESRLKRLMAEVTASEGSFLKRHASGHAHPDDLRRFVEDVNPRLLVPVHTTNAGAFRQWWPSTRLASDGEPMEL